jgi:hypothetical protein
VKQFYNKILPDEGHYCVAAINDGVIQPKFTTDKGELVAIVNSLNGVEGNNVYFTPGTYKSNKRVQKDCVFIRAFFLDIDCKGRDKKNNYANRQEGLVETAKFIETVKLPEPIIVDSGYGLHFYWPFTEAVDAATWVSTARLLKSLCSAHGLIFDPAVPADSARLMRCPGTQNKVRTSKILRDAPAHSFEELKTAIENAAELIGINTQPTIALEGFIRSEVDDATKAFLEGKRGDFKTSFVKILKMASGGCLQLNEAFANQETTEEPLWRAALSVAHACTDGEKAIHLVSVRHPDYTPEATERKAAETKGPYGCKAFESVNPGGCEGCVNKEKIDNPIKLHKELKPPVPQGTRQRDPFPPDMFPYFRGPISGIYRKAMQKKGDEDSEEDICIYAFDLEIIRRYMTKDVGEVLDIELHLPNDEPRSAQLFLSRLTSRDLFQKDLGALGVTATPANWIHIMDYTRKWAEYLQKVSSAKMLREQLGWAEDLTSFAHGGTEYYPDGTTAACPITITTKEVTKIQNTGGTFEKWREAFQGFNKKGFETHAFIALAGFGSPLTRISSGNGAVINAYSVHSGTGKTISMYGALSLWGEPKGLFIKDSTQAGRLQRAAVVNSHPLGIDEATNIPDNELSELIYSIAAGKTKVRMTSSANVERSNFFPWSLITIMTSNSNFYVKLNEHRKGAQGEMARLLQFEMKRPTLMGVRQKQEDLDALNYNYGWAGPKFISQIVQDIKGSKQRALAWAKKFERDFPVKPHHRFYTDTIACIFAGTEFANELKIIDFEIPRIYDNILVQLEHIDAATSAVVKQSQELLEDYINENYNGILSVDSKSDSRGQDFLPGRTPMGNKGLLIRYENDRNMLYVLKSTFDSYLTKNNHDLKEFEKNMYAAKTLVSIKRMQMAKGWRNGPQLLANAYVFKFTLDEDSLQDNMNDSEE